MSIPQNIQDFMKLIKFHESAASFQANILEAIKGLSQNQFKKLVMNWSDSSEVDNNSEYTVLNMTEAPRAAIDGILFSVYMKRMYINSFVSEFSHELIRSIITS